MRRLLQEIRSCNNERENRMYGINALTSANDQGSADGFSTIKKKLKNKLKKRVKALQYPKDEPPNGEEGSD